MTSSTNEETVLITGASMTSIGGHLALEFRKLGYTVFATSRDTATLTPLEAHGIHCLQLDVTSADSLERCKAEVEQLMNSVPKLNILVNNAAVWELSPSAETTIERTRLVMETNVVGVVAVTQTFMPWLKESQGRVVFLGSAGAIVPLAFQGVYCASKAAVHHYARTLRMEIKPFDVKVIELVTGLVKTRLARNGFEFEKDSAYLLLNDRHKTMADELYKQASDPAWFAKSTVKQIVKNNPWDEVYRGFGSWMAYWAVLLLPVWIVDWIYETIFGFRWFKAQLAKEKRSQ